MKLHVNIKEEISPPFRCEQEFEDPKELYNHERQEHDPVEKEANDNICRICDKSLASDAILRRHLKNQHEVTPESGHGTSCPSCDSFKGNAREIENHLEDVHKILLEKDSIAFQTVTGELYGK